MMNILPNKYDRVTRLLHAALAIGVVTQLLLSAVMKVPAGRGLGVPDWHRAAFEWHAKVGISVAAICLCHWVWILLPRAKPGYVHLFPWLKRDGREALRREWKARPPSSHASLSHLAPLVGTVHGLGFLAVTGSAMCGLVNYLGYFLGAPIPRWVLHGVGMAHIAFGYLIWAFVIAHVTMAVLHRVVRERPDAWDVPSR
ncbi:cytochrome b/b6 domain-containing protein [Dyella mobilis]|uniref:Cytochrome b/b6 domain-containing protein n=1 Tax=Dyella mobilis TaxID=1849582 RepID=A0ABS2KEW9_9GAMM|nr:cytochrome b/b6 domain-containing protein [Dyella mobilis]MBM7129463.1 cytochrome b/b6 domain-containing protein [Dyella mobilis]GLQ98273.1 hypothetical protein GCM10007863_26930 [Dyella mobilis]